MNIHTVKALILDMDGVLWRDSEWLVDPAKTFARLTKAGFRFAFATNNATRTVDYYLEKFGAVGVDLEPWQVMNSALATARELRDRHPNGGTVFVVGEWGLENTLLEHGFANSANAPVAVVSGLDRTITYQKLETATHLINAGVPFIGTNPDRSFPTPSGPVPGAGAILAAIQAATGVEPEIIGKPKPTMYRQLLPLLGTTPEETLVIGDRLETDIEGAQALGCQSALVLSGISSETDAKNWSPPPGTVCQDLNILVDLLLT